MESLTLTSAFLEVYRALESKIVWGFAKQARGSGKSVGEVNILFISRKLQLYNVMITSPRNFLSLKTLPAYHTSSIFKYKWMSGKTRPFVVSSCESLKLFEHKFHVLQDNRK